MGAWEVYENWANFGSVFKSEPSDFLKMRYGCMRLSVVRAQREIDCYQLVHTFVQIRKKCPSGDIAILEIIF